ncbi:MAG: tetratricopeptide repeat protein [Deltaproteobacteria bacterium]|nr:tetratricopeptide repeat protein [Deltaproteobacteria bacterium]
MTTPTGQIPGTVPGDAGQKGPALPRDYSGLALKSAELFKARGVNLDFSLASLGALDDWIDGKWGKSGLGAGNPEWRPDKEQSLAINQIGCYLGALVIKLFGGTWKDGCNADGPPYSVGVVVEGANLTAYPFAAARGRLKHGEARRLSLWLSGISAGILTGDDAGAGRLMQEILNQPAPRKSAAPPPPRQPQEPQPQPLDGPLKRAVELKFKGADFAREGRFLDAIKCLDEAVGLVRDFAEGWSSKGTCLYALKRNNEAFAAFDRAVDARPLQAAGWFSKGICEANLSMNERAMASLQFYLHVATPDTPENAEMINIARQAVGAIEKAGVRQTPAKAVALAFEGYGLSASGSFDKSLPLFEEAVRLAPRLSKAWQWKAMCLDNVGRRDGAIKDYARALEIEPRNAVFWYNKACIFGKMKRLDEAIKSYAKTVEADPSYLEAWSNKGRIHGTLRQYEESIVCLEKALALGPSAEAWLNKALAEDETGRKARARVSYEKFLELARPEHTQQISHARKRIAELGGPSTGAEARYQSAPVDRRASAREAETWNQKGIKLFNANRLDEAVKCFDMAILLDPDSPMALHNKGLALSDLNREDEAIRCYDKALEINPDIAGAWLNKGASLNRSGRFEEAAACFDRATALSPGELLGWYNKGKNLADMGRDGEAVECYDRALSIDPKDTSAWCNKGCSLQKLKRHAEALACFDTTLSIDQRHAFGWNNKGESLNALGRFEEAIKCFDAALAIKTFASPWCGKGNSLRALSRHRAAIAEYKKAVERYDEYSEAWRGKALSEDKINLKDDAIASYKRFLSCASRKDEAAEIAGVEARLRELGVTEADMAEASRKRDAAPSQAPAKGTGRFIGQKYEIYRELGKGGFGVVYQVYSHETQSVYALKTFRDEYMRDDQTRALFLKEAQTLVDMDPHPFLVEDYFVDEIGGRLYIAMEYVAPDEHGLNTLTSYLRKRPPDLAQALRWAVQFCHGIEFVYSQGVKCHRDIKPDNIMINQQKTVKISDFGLAGIMDTIQAVTDAGDAVIDGGVGRTMRGAGFGTATHMPPEQFDNAADCDERSDVYSFGVVLYQMASAGAYPFMARPPADNSPGEANRFWNEMRGLHLRAAPPRLNSPLQPVIERCMAKRPEDRYQTFASLRAELEPLLYRLAGEKVTVPAREEMNAAEWLNKGLSLKNLGRLDEAVACYDKALEMKPRDSTASMAYSNKGNCRNLSGRVDEAIQCYDQALRLDPKNEKAWCNKGYMLQQQGRFQEALACYGKSLEIVPEFAIAWNNKSFTYLSLQDYKKAIECADAAIRHNPNEDAAWVNKGAALYAQNKNREAIVCYEKSLEINPRCEPALYNKGLILNEEKRYRDAIAAFDRVIEINPGYGAAFCARGNALLCLSNHQEALRSLERAIELNPKHATPWYYKGYVMINLKRNADAITCLKRFMELAGPRQKTQIEDARARIAALDARRRP